MERETEFDQFEEPAQQGPTTYGSPVVGAAGSYGNANATYPEGAYPEGAQPEGAYSPLGQPSSYEQYQPVAPAAFVPPAGGPGSVNVRNQAPQRPESVDFGTMPQPKKTHKGLVVGVVLGCLLLVAGILAGAHAFTGWVGKQFERGSQNSGGSDLFGDWDTFHDFDWNEIEGLDGKQLEQWLKEHGYSMDPDIWSDGGSTLKPSADPAADDGFLHDARNENVSYRIKEEEYSHTAEGERVDAYGMDMDLVFDVQYPSLEGDLPHKDEINELIRTTAMDFVTRAYLQPEQALVDIVKNAHDSGMDTDEEGMEHLNGRRGNPLLYEEKTYAITYNSDKLISIVFSDSYRVDSNSFLKAQELNINLETGEVYTFDDVLQTTDAAAQHWAKNILEYLSARDVMGPGASVDTSAEQGQEAIANCITGKDATSMHIEKGFFIDAAGKVNFNVSWRGSNDHSQGWWDVTLTDDELAQAKKDSSLWSLL